MIFVTRITHTNIHTHRDRERITTHKKCRNYSRNALIAVLLYCIVLLLLAKCSSQRNTIESKLQFSVEMMKIKATTWKHWILCKGKKKQQLSWRNKFEAIFSATADAELPQSMECETNNGKIIVIVKHISRLMRIICWY